MKTIKNLGPFKIQVEDNLFNATDLIRQVNKVNGVKRGKSVFDFLRNKKTREFIEIRKVQKFNYSVQWRNTWLDNDLFRMFSVWLDDILIEELVKYNMTNQKTFKINE